jgi:hypothetical protein
MAQLTKEQVLGVKDILTEVVNVPEWGGEVTVTVMDGPSRDEWEMMLYADGKANTITNRRAKLCAMTIIDPQTSKRLFSPDELAKKSGVALSRVFDAALRLNKIGGDAIEQASKNSSDPGNGSSMTSPGPGDAR